MSKQNPEGIPANLSEEQRRAQVAQEAGGGYTNMIGRENVTGAVSESGDVVTGVRSDPTATQELADQTTDANYERVAKIRNEEREAKERAAEQDAERLGQQPTQER